MALTRLPVSEERRGGEVGEGRRGNNKGGGRGRGRRRREVETLLSYIVTREHLCIDERRELSLSNLLQVFPAQHMHPS